MRARSKVSLLNRLAASDGIGVIEILAAMGVMALVTTGMVPVILSGLRSTIVSKGETAAKNLTQERFELMRNSPFYVGSSTASPPASCTDPARITPKNAAGAPECDYRDVLDTYFRSTVPASSAFTGGYVATGAARSADEVKAGVAAPFYRYVIDPLPGVVDGGFSQTVATQFLTADRAVVAPPSTFNSQDSDTDLPPSRLLGVTVITRWSAGSKSRSFSVFSQIADGQIREGGTLNDPTTVVLQAEAVALRVRSAVDPSVALQAEAGVSRADGVLFNAARASTSAQGAYAELTPGARVDGRSQTASTPPESAPPAQGSGASGSLSATAGSTSFAAVRFGATDVENVTAGVETGQPMVPRTAPGTNLATGRLLHGGATSDFSFTNASPEALNGLELLDTSRPLISAKAASGGDLAAGKTYVKSVSGTGHYAESGARATLGEVRLFPTTFASEGLVQVQVNSAAVTCKTTGGSTTGTASSFDITVRYFSQLGYVTVPISSSGAPLSNLLPDPNTIAIAPGLTLGSYISSWTHLTAATLNINPASSPAASLNGVLHITSQQTRLEDPTSPVKVDFGILSCLAEDRR